MKRFYGSIFIEKEKLEEAGIKEPIKLEYYKIINKNENKNEIKDEKEYGIEIVKTQYKENDAQVEGKMVENISNSEERIDEILRILKNNEVTPICLQDILYDLT